MNYSYCNCNEYSKRYFDEFVKDMSEFCTFENIHNIDVKIICINDLSPNARSYKSSENQYTIEINHGIFSWANDTVTELLKIFKGMFKEKINENLMGYIIKYVLWHEFAHIILGHDEVPRDVVNRICEEDKNSFIIQQLEYMADGIAIRNFLIFIFTDALEDKNVLGLFLAVLYSYFCKNDESDKEINNFPLLSKMRKHPCPAIRFVLARRFIEQTMKEYAKTNGTIVDMDIIDEIATNILEELDYNKDIDQIVISQDANYYMNELRDINLESEMFNYVKPYIE
ncbi:hypothetical protein [Clostridium sp.]|uniref:hypothetical protein n=1 Tax=Clostridium sp. TaxID=1506 RepID=UPI003217BC48